MLRLHKLVGHAAVPPPEQVQVHLVLFVGRGDVAQRLCAGPFDVRHRGRLVEHDDGLHELLLLQGRQGVEHLHRGGQGLAGGRGRQRNQLLQGFGGVAGGIVPQQAGDGARGGGDRRDEGQPGA